MDWPCNSRMTRVTAALAFALTSTFAVLVYFCVPLGAIAEPRSDQDALEKASVAFASMVWLSRLDSACALYKNGLISQEQLPEAYRILCQVLATGPNTPEAKNTFSKLMELLSAVPKAMDAYWEASESDIFQLSYVIGCPLPNKEIGY